MDSLQSHPVDKTPKQNLLTRGHHCLVVCIAITERPYSESHVRGGCPFDVCDQPSSAVPALRRRPCTRWPSWAPKIIVVARDPDKAGRCVQLGHDLGAQTRLCALDNPALADATSAASVLVSTIPADMAAGCAETLAGVPVLLDAVYDSWPTPLAAAVAAAGGRVVSGLQMLLHQAFAQVDLFTGLPAPREAMTCALAAAD